MNRPLVGKTMSILDSAQETLSVGEIQIVAISPFMLDRRIACLLTAMGKVGPSELLKEDTATRNFIKHHIEYY